MLAALALSPAYAQDIAIEQARSLAAPEPTLRLKLGLELGPRATLALESGLVLGLQVDWELNDGRALTQTLWLRYSPLLRRYALAIGERPTQQFRLRNALLAAVENAQLSWPAEVRCENACGGRARIQLAVNSLPAPLRLPALTQREWRLDSGWQALVHE